MTKKIIQTIRAFIVGALIFAGFHQLAIASETGVDVSKEIANLRDLVEWVEMYTVPDSVSFNVRIYEKDVVRRGCRYIASERNDIVTLLGVLEAAELREGTLFDENYETRLVIYLHMRDGTSIPLVMTREYTEVAAWGIYNRKVRITSTLGFGDSLRKWKSEHSPVRPDSIMCKDTFLFR